jgi:hypothetical protein
MVGLDPLGHVMHAADPIADLYFPAVHRTHTAPSPPVYPVRQVQEDSDGLPSFEEVLLGHAIQLVAAGNEYVPTAHGVQNQEPVDALNVPASQGVHSSPSAPVYPARQVQIELPTDDEEFLEHGEQVLTSKAASSLEKEFAPHDMQAAEPVADFHVPAPQGVHAEPSGPVYPARQVQDASSRGLSGAETVLFGHAVQFAALVRE